MRSRKIGYWVTTALVAFVFVVGGLFDLGQGTQVIEELGHLGYPRHLALLLGGWKVLGAAAVLAPGLPRLKEWAYAGMMFELTGAAISHAAVSDGAGKLLPPIVLLALLFASWALRPESRRLSGVERAREPEAAPRSLDWARAA